MKEEKIFNEKIKSYIILLIVTMYLCAPMLMLELDVYIDDGIQHIARAIGTEASIRDGSFFGNVINNFCNGFGYSWNLFYGMLSCMGIIMGKLIMGSYIKGYKLFMFISLFASGCTMYKMMKEISEDNNIGLIAGILYLTFPYHLTDLYTRNAVGEFISFIFIPLVFLGLYNLTHNRKKDYYLSIGMIGLILSHNLSTIIVCFFAMLYFLYNIKCIKDRKVIKRIIFNVIITFLCTAFFVLPLLEAKFTTDYAVYQKDVMATKEYYLDRALDFKQLFIKVEGEYSFEISVAIIAILIFSRIDKIKDEYRKDYVFFLLTGVICLVMSTKDFPWKYIPGFYTIIQFPWRFIGIGMFFLCVAASFGVRGVIKDIKLFDIFIITIVSLAFFYASFLIDYCNEPLEEKEYNNLATISGEERGVSWGIGKEEYLPMKAYENRQYIVNRESGAIVLEGDADITNELKENGKYKSDIKADFSDSNNTIIELPYLYYPGYKVTSDGVKMKCFETEYGMVGIKIDNDKKNRIEAYFAGTALTKLSIVISLFGLTSLIIYCNAEKIFKNSRLFKDVL